MKPRIPPCPSLPPCHKCGAPTRVFTGWADSKKGMAKLQLKCTNRGKKASGESGECGCLKLWRYKVVGKEEKKK